MPSVEVLNGYFFYDFEAYFIVIPIMQLSQIRKNILNKAENN
jgi:hypothetical protein